MHFLTSKPTSALAHTSHCTWDFSFESAVVVFGFGEEHVCSSSVTVRWTLTESMKLLMQGLVDVEM